MTTFIPRKSRMPAWLNPINVLTGLIVVVLLLSVYGWTADKVNTDLSQRLVNIAIDQNNKQIHLSEDIRKQNQIDIQQNLRLQNITSDIKLILNQQGNLSKDAREQVINSIIKNEQEVIPQILNMTAEAHEFWTFLRTNFNEEYLANEYRQYAQSNETQEKLDQILMRLNSSSLS